MTGGRRLLGVATVGLGVGEQHVRAFQATGRCRVRWLCDLDAEKAKRFAAEVGGGALAGSFDDILADGETEAVSIASYDDAHAEQVVAALAAGKHVFVEKPLCRSLAELEAIRRAWAKADRHLVSNLVLRAAPLYRWLHDAIRGGELGEVYAFDGEYLFGRIEKITEGWRKDVEGYSVMLGGGVHLIDLMLWLAGERPVSVAAAGNRIATAGTSFRYPDFVAATFRFPSGLVGRITANFGCVHRHQHVVRVFGTRATFLYDDQGPRLHASRDPASKARVIDLAPLPATKGELIPAFVEAVLDGADTRAQTEEAFDAVRACLAADRALAGGAWTEVERA